MSDGISRIELKAAHYGRYADEEGEGSGLLRTAPDPESAQRGGGNDDGVSAGACGYDDSELLPVMIENGLEKIGCL